MAITYWPKHGSSNLEASMAQYVDRIIGFADHASSDTAFMAKWTSNDGTNDTYTISAGSYIFNGYLFTAAGTETLVVDHGTSINGYLAYVTDSAGHINEAGVYKYADLPTAGAGETVQPLLLWNFNAGTITDYRQVFTWGRSSYGNADSGCVDILSATTSTGVGATTYGTGAASRKEFRCAYPGSVYLSYDYCASGTTTDIDVYKVRGGTGTLFSSTDVASSYPTYTSVSNVEVDGLMPGDLITIQGDNPAATYYVRNFRIRYKTTDTPTAAMLVD